MSMRVIFLRHRSIGSALLRTALWSAWSHVALLNEPGNVIEANARHGVRSTWFPELLRQASVYQLGLVDCDACAVWDFAREQIGKPYDWTAVFGLGLHRDWQRDDAWFCSELVAAALLAGGADLVRKKTGRVTPQDLYQSPLVRIMETA
jgi:uncharacterized protein YycO